MRDELGHITSAGTKFYNFKLQTTKSPKHISIGGLDGSTVQRVNSRFSLSFSLSLSLTHTLSQASKRCGRAPTVGRRRWHWRPPWVLSLSSSTISTHPELAGTFSNFLAGVTTMASNFIASSRFSLCHSSWCFIRDDNWQWSWICVFKINSEQDFIVQGGDPTGTGRGGESIYGY